MLSLPIILNYDTVQMILNMSLNNKQMIGNAVCGRSQRFQVMDIKTDPKFCTNELGYKSTDYASSCSKKRV